MSAGTTFHIGSHVKLILFRFSFNIYDVILIMNNHDGSVLMMCACVCVALPLTVM